MPNPALPSNVRALRIAWALGSIAVLAALGACIYQTWFAHRDQYDDSFIYYRITRNLWQGIGPYFNAGGVERTNTSLLYPYLTAWAWALPTNAAIQATTIFDWLCMAGTWVFFGLGMAAVAQRRFSWPAAYTFGPATLLVASRMGVSYGMETQLYTLLIAFVFWCFATRRTQAALVASCLGIFIRPEGVFLTAAAFAQPLLFAQGPLKARIPWRAIWIGIALAALYAGYSLYYFHALIPHTAAVKALLFADRAESIHLLGDEILLPRSIPTYLIGLSILGLCWGLAEAAVFPIAVFTLLYTAFFTLFGTWNVAFGWYRIPLQYLLDAFAFLGGCLVLHLAQQLLALGRKPVYTYLAAIGTGAYLTIAAFYIYKSYDASRVMLSLQGNGFAARVATGKAVARYLERHTPKDKAVMVEPLGIIGFYAPNVHFKDFPGLASLEVYHCLRRFADSTHPQNHFFYSTNTDEFFYLLRCVPGLAYVVLRQREFQNMRYFLKPGPILNPPAFYALPADSSHDTYYRVLPVSAVLNAHAAWRPE